MAKKYIFVNKNLKKARVIKSTGSWATVKNDDNQIVDCKIKGNFRLKEIKNTNPVAVGDLVEYDTIEHNDNGTINSIGLIHKIEKRKNYIIRKSQNLSKQAHIIAANIDQAFLIITINFPLTTTTFIDRFLVSAEAYSIPVTLVFNKIDRFDKKHIDKLKLLTKTYENIGYKCLQTSAKTGEGIDTLKTEMTDKINVVSGHSGVGKSTLINILQPGLNLKTNEISESHKTGKHSTTFAEMFEFDFGGYIIDTPGIKAYGMLEMEAWEISHYFPEIFKVSKNCQFQNCSHTHEPECAVKTAIKNGEIAESRYISYLGLLEKDDKHRAAF